MQFRLVLSLALVLATACGRNDASSGRADSGLRATLPPSSVVTPALALAPATPEAGTAPSDAVQVSSAVARANQIRRENNLPEFRLDPALTVAAQKHAEDMRARNYFEHKSPEGLSPGDRIRREGGSFWSWGENIAMGQRDAQEVFQGWLDSPGHAENLLRRSFGRHGIGYSGGYWVHDFAD